MRHISRERQRLAGLCLARRETRVKREQVLISRILKLTLEKEKRNPSRHHQRCQHKSHSSHQYIHLTCPDRRPSFVALEGPLTQPKQRDSAGVEVWTEAWLLVQALSLLISSWVLLSLSPVSFSSDSFTRIIWRLKYGVKLNGCRDERMRVVMFLWLGFRYRLLPSQESLDTRCCHNDNHG